MAIAKFFLLLVAVIAQQYATTAPNVRPPTGELREQRGSERAVPYFTAFFRILVWSWAFLQGSVLFALSGFCPPALTRSLLHVLLPASLAKDTTAHTTLAALTPASLAGALLTLIGALLRVHCFHALGPRFTFELSIRPSHALVTSGVYGVVRHPSYTGVIAIAVGWFLCVLDPRGWVMAVCVGREGGIGHGNALVTGVLACIWAAALGMLYAVANERMNKEDAMLEKNFGEEWRAWARRVRYRLVPGVY